MVFTDTNLEYGNIVMSEPDNYTFSKFMSWIHQIPRGHYISQQNNTKLIFLKENYRNKNSQFCTERKTQMKMELKTFSAINAF